MASSKLLLLLLLAILASFLISSTSATSDDEDFVPGFFSGRRHHGDHAGMDPPPPKLSKLGSRSMSSAVKVMKFRQKLNHENATCRKSFVQRYLMNDAYFNPNRSRPIIFIRVGGESNVNESDLLSGRMVELAKRHRALILELELRYYGESKPTTNLKTANLAFLTYQQAIADLEAFVQYIRRLFGKDGRYPRIVLYGCSYAGSLAAFHRMTYPNSTEGALSVCAPLQASETYADYVYLVFDAISKVDHTCMKNLIDAFRSIQETLLRNRTDNYHLCEPRHLLNRTTYDPNETIYPEELELLSFAYDFSFQLMSIVQYNRMSLGEESEVRQMCRFLKNDSIGDYVARYFAWLKAMGQDCLKHDGRIVLSKNTEWNSTLAKSGTRQWLYQMCTQFGYFTGLYNDDLSNAIAMRKICNDSFSIYSSEITVLSPWIASAAETLSNLTKQATKIIFIHGKQDPWYKVGVDGGKFALDMRSDSGRSLTEIYAERDILVKLPEHASHCEEPVGYDYDYPDLVQAYDEADRKITSWISAI